MIVGLQRKPCSSCTGVQEGCCDCFSVMFSVGNKKKTPSDKTVTTMTSQIVVFNVMELFLTVKLQLDLFLLSEFRHQEFFCLRFDSEDHSA